MTAAVAGGQSLPRVSLHFAGQKWAAQLAPTAAPGEGSLGAVLALASTDKIIASYRDILNWVLIGGAISIVIALLLSYLLAMGILRPVRTMAEAAEQAAAGNYKTQIGLKGNDELARLSRSLIRCCRICARRAISKATSAISRDFFPTLRAKALRRRYRKRPSLRRRIPRAAKR